jgi:hypothetical protein
VLLPKPLDIVSYIVAIEKPTGILWIYSLFLLISACSNIDRRVLAIEGHSRVVSVSLPVVLLPFTLEKMYCRLPLSEVLESKKPFIDRSSRRREGIQGVLPATQQHVSCIDQKRKARHRPPRHSLTPSTNKHKKHPLSHNPNPKTTLIPSPPQTTSHLPPPNNQRETPWQNKPSPATCTFSASPFPKSTPPAARPFGRDC